MPGRLSLTPSRLAEGHYVVAVCRICGAGRYPSRARMIEACGDVSLDLIEPRLRCVARNRDKRGPACGGAMTIELAAPRTIDPDWAVG